MKKLLLVLMIVLSTLNATEVTLQEKITGLYVAFFNRAADEKGLSFWTQRGEESDNQAEVLKELSAGFATHPSFERAYGGLDNKAFVEEIYRNTLGRDGDAAGIAYWSGLLDEGMSRSDFVAIFVEAALTFDRDDPQYASLSQEDLEQAQLRQDLLANKVEAALRFTTELGDLTNVVDSQNPEDDPAYKASIKIISEINEDHDTTQIVVDFLDDIKESDDPIAQINNIKSFMGSVVYGYVMGNDISDTNVYIDFGDGNISAKSIVNNDGSFSIRLSDEDLAKINPEVPEGADAPIDDLLIVAEKDGHILRNAISRDINSTKDIYISADTESYAQLLESIGAFSTNDLNLFNDELIDGYIMEDSSYASFIEASREDIAMYFDGGEKPTNSTVFQKALSYIDKSVLSQIADDKSLLFVRDIVSGGDIVLPDDINVSSDDIAIISKGNGRYTLGDGSNGDETIYLQVSKSDGTFALIPINIKSKTVTTIVNRAVTPQEGATLGNDNDGVKIVIPPFALNETQNITIKKIESEGESSDGKKILDLEPHGTQFQIPITIKINYADFGVDDPYAVQWKYGSLDEGYDAADIVSIDTANKVIYLNVDHFSDLVVKEINEQKFLDLGPKFVLIYPRRAYHSRLYPDRVAIQYEAKTITNRIFQPFSKHQAFSIDTFNTEGTISGGQCVQFAKYFYYPLKYNKIGINRNFASSSQASNIKAKLVSLFNGKELDNDFSLPNNANNYIRNLNGLTNSDALNYLGVRRREGDCQRGDIVIMDITGSSTGHVAVYYGNEYIIDSNWQSNESIGTNNDIKHRISDYALSINNNEIFISRNGGTFLCLANPLSSETSIANGSAITNDDLIDNAFPYSVVKNNYTKINGHYNTGTYTVTDKPYLYYLVSKINDGIIKVVNNYKYNPDLLPVAPLRVSFDTNGIGKMQNTEDALYEIYAEDNTSILTANNISGKTIKTYQLNYDGLQGGPKYLTREEICDVISSYKSGDIGWINAVLLSGNELVSELGFGGNDNVQREKSVTCDDVIAQLKSKDRANSGSVKLVASSNSLSFDGNALYKFETEDNIATLNMFSNPSPYIKSPKLQKILFSPIVIDDYYINWGTTNEKNMQPKPIGFWNQYGYDLEYKGEYGTSTTLEAGKIYSSVEAVNGYFMTLGEGKEAQWHFALAGSHTILVNVPTKKKSDIEHATYTLHNDGKTILLQIANDSGVALENDAFNNWYYLKSQDNNTSFELTGNDFLEVKAEGGVVIVDAIRLEGMADRMAEIKGKANLKDTEDESKLENLLTLYNPANGKKVEMVTEYGQGYVLPVPKSLDYTLKLECTYTPRLKIWSGLYNRSLSRDATSENLETKYKPVTQTITIHPGDSIVNLAEVTLMPYKTKENVKLHLINAVNGSAITDANVTIRYGIDNDDNQSVAYSGLTDENGYFEIKDMPYGQYSAVLSKTGFISTSLNLKVDEESDSINDLSMSPILAEGEIRIRLSWGADPSDLDSHLVKYVDDTQAYHIYYGTPNGTDGDNLDRDDTDGFGPETITINQIDLSSEYIYFVHKYSGYGEIKNSGASVKISYGNQEQTFYPPSEDGDIWKVFSIKDGAIVPCVGKCMMNVDELDSLRSINRDRILFKNLPPK